MKRKIELLAPGGDLDSIKTAIIAGADAVYCGLDKFNARNRASNINFEELQGILRLAHKNDCQTFLTLNIIIPDNEIPELFRLFNKLINTSIDGVIIQDLGLFYLISKYFKGLNIHASTQLTTHNEGQVKFLSKLNATRVNLSRELNIHEIKTLTAVGNENNVLTEVFVHGSYCISFSGICYISSVHGGNSGNRGRCSQPCRDRYNTTAVGKDYPLNLKDNSAYFDLKELYNAGVYSLKIEGRIKEFEYVYTVVSTWKKQLQSFYAKNILLNDNSNLYKVFNRDFSNSFLKGDINKDMFIDSPTSFSTKHLSEIHNYTTNDEKIKGQTELYKEKEEVRNHVKNIIDKLSIEKIPLTINISGEYGVTLKVSVNKPGTSFSVFSESKLVNIGLEPLTSKVILRKLKAIDDSEYYIEKFELNLKGELYLPFRELTLIKRKLLFILNDSKEYIDPINVPVLKKQNKEKIKPTLSVLISSPDDLDLSIGTHCDIYFQLPTSVKNKSSELNELFLKNKTLLPWFPAILIGEDFTAAVELLHKIRPNCIVTNNTGIAYEAYKKGIPWIAGPYLNIVNSYGLLCLKEEFNCSGSFISNELNKTQIKQINGPDNFKLYFSIYHPIVLMTSRQCLFHQVTGCKRNIIDNSCIQQCEKSSSIINSKGHSLLIEKAKGNYHNIYNEINYLNTDIVTDIQNLFSGFFIDLREIKTETKVDSDKLRIIKLYENLLSRNSDSIKDINQIIYPSTKTQYEKGI